MAGRRGDAYVRLLLAYLLISSSSARDKKEKLYGVPPALSKEVTVQTRNCFYKHSDFNYENKTYCRPVYDTYLCWGPTLAGEIATQSCYDITDTETTDVAFRRCGENGKWLGREEGDYAPIGWTNYSLCFPDDPNARFLELYNDDELVETKLLIAMYSKVLRICGFALSFVGLMLSQVIFCCFRRVLVNDRITIHKQLFAALLLQCVLQLGLIFEQMAYESHTNILLSPEIYKSEGLGSKPHMCASTYVMLQYCITVQYLWMFLEGFHLYKILNVHTAQYRLPFWTYMGIGWGLSVVVTAIWATLHGLFAVSKYANDDAFGCWYGYSSSPSIWILYGFIILIVAINVYFLLNIVRVLLRQMSRKQSSKLQKTTRAIFILSPLFGLTSVLVLFEGPVARGAVGYAIWNFVTILLSAYQGLFISVVYCFLNLEVKQSLSKTFKRYFKRDDLDNRPELGGFLNRRGGRGGGRGRAGSSSPGRVQRPPGEGGSWISMQDLNMTTLGTDRSSSDPRRSSNDPRRSSSAMSAQTTRRTDDPRSLESGALSPNEPQRVIPRASICTVTVINERESPTAQSKSSHEGSRPSSTVSFTTTERAQLHRPPTTPTTSAAVQVVSQPAVGDREATAITSTQLAALYTEGTVEIVLMPEATKK